MTLQKKVRIGVVGVGIMGGSHVRDVISLPNAELAAICDIDTQKSLLAADHDVPFFTDYNEMLAMDGLDAIIIATPHYDHPGISLAALEKGIHVLVEKPVAVHINEAQRMNDGYEAALKIYPSLKFGVVFMQRTYGHWLKIKDLVDSGELGELMRTTWIITDWFRTQYYYDMGGWRASWKGEGGGILMNQAPHNLDLYQWLVGMPSRVHGFASFGKHHRIEVEDEVTAYFEHANGMVGHFITTTGESPGTNRLEIVGENGKLVYENNVLLFYRNRFSSRQQIAEAQTGFEKVESWQIDVPYAHHGQSGHRHIIANFVDAILNDAPLVAPAVEGIYSLMIDNAIILSAYQNQTVDLPIDGDVYEALLNRLIAESTRS
ncbi:Gfo/Idh/MocA family oxidoreductase [Phototrophicus methaneseepsis]|uniref:Gfo/Idh/MocA family oxidoreductase n=2 Tax=Phototrophicus methaneseepsis TaxID=2710758 RepID=A0A7S8EDU9_9CHLR|nr:Gfo/Idh/MocA family oxidoreductase [Phototrophicus methaneseepsis]